MKNIRDLIAAKNLKLKHFTPEVVTHINKFENINDFEKVPDFYARDNKERRTKRRRSAKLVQADKNSVLN